MKFSRTITALYALALTLIAFSSCEEEDTTQPSLQGSVVFSYPEFIRPDTTITFPRPTGVIHPEGKGYGLKWNVTGEMSGYDIVKTEDGSVDSLFKFHFEDSIKTYTVNCVAFATGYSSISGSGGVTTVRGGMTDISSVQYKTAPKVDTTFIDKRDSTVIYAILKDTLWWTIRNAAYKVPGKYLPYRKCHAMRDVTGLYYNYEGALQACPEGWRLPTLEEWYKVCGGIDGVAGKFFCYATINGSDLLEWWPDMKVDNSSGLSVLPFGYCNVVDGIFTGFTSTAAFWTGTQFDENYGIYVYLLNQNKDLYVEKAFKTSFGASVRCVLDKKR